MHIGSIETFPQSTSCRPLVFKHEHEHRRSPPQPLKLMIDPSIKAQPQPQPNHHSLTPHVPHETVNPDPDRPNTTSTLTGTPSPRPGKFMHWSTEDTLKPRRKQVVTSDVEDHLQHEDILVSSRVGVGGTS